MESLTVIVPSMKHCRKCNTDKPVSDFRKLKSSKYGLYSYCRACHNAESRQYKKGNRDKIREKNREYQKMLRETRPERVKAQQLRYKPQRKEYHRKYYLANKTRIRKRATEYYERNRSRWIGYLHTFSEKYPDRISAQNHKRRAGRSTGEHYTAQQWNDLCDKYGNVCLCCGSSHRLTVDHIIPLCKGGTNCIQNIQPLCYKCNRKKWKQTIDYRS
jgi:5-methylcytosine-specific restriction endonuclease McrA